MSDISEVSEGAREAAIERVSMCRVTRQNSSGEIVDAVISALITHYQQHPEEAAELWESLGMPGFVERYWCMNCEKWLHQSECRYAGHQVETLYRRLIPEEGS